MPNYSQHCYSPCAPLPLVEQVTKVSLLSLLALAELDLASCFVGCPRVRLQEPGKGNLPNRRPARGPPAEYLDHVLYLLGLAVAISDAS